MARCGTLIDGRGFAAVCQWLSAMIRCFCHNPMDRGNHGGIAPTSCASRTELEAFAAPGCCGYSLNQYFYLTCCWLINSVITLTVLDAFQLTSCTQIDRRLSRGVGAGLFNLSAPFKDLGEPAPCILKEVDCDLLLGGGGLIEIFGTCYILLVKPPLQDIHCGTFCYKIVRLT